jgi:hypothetical protein
LAGKKLVIGIFEGLWYELGKFIVVEAFLLLARQERMGEEATCLVVM